MIIPMFVYGTLRVGESNHKWASKGEVQEPLLNMRVPGSLYYAYGRFSYPVAKISTPASPVKCETKIVGDILYMNPDSKEWDAVFAMEWDAGYRLTDAECTDADGKYWGTVAVWHYMHDVSRKEPVPNNDWSEAQRALEAEESHTLRALNDRAL